MNYAHVTDLVKPISPTRKPAAALVRSLEQVNGGMSKTLVLGADAVRNSKLIFKVSCKID